jgi:hypothetical protein
MVDVGEHPADGRLTLYRIVESNPPTLRDFLSNHA